MLVAADAKGSFSVDTCSLIQLKDVYPQRRFPKLWERIAELFDEFCLFICQQVTDEIDDPELKEFIAQHISPVHLADFEAHLSGLMIYLHGAGIELTKSGAKKTEADPFVVALALKLDGRDPAKPAASEGASGRGAVVTEENSRSNRKIPAVCRSLDLQCMNLLDLFDAMGYLG